MVVVGADETPGKILLTAKSKGLQSASVTLFASQ
jgi:hypothetical protein